MPQIEESTLIAGVYLVHLKPFADERGRFIETFRKEWFPGRNWESVQTNRSDSKASVLRGLHFHKKQVDYWYISQGKIRAALVDLRPESASYLVKQMITLDGDTPMGLYIPVGVAHGFVALTDCTLNYIVDNYYDSTDEFGLAWNDPQIALEWGVENPIVSGRDQNNPRLEQIVLTPLAEK